MIPFTKIFLSFFKLKPPTRKKAPKGATFSLNKMLLVSRLIYILGLTDNDKFLDSDDSLKGFFKQYKDFEMNMANGIYIK